MNKKYKIGEESEEVFPHYSQLAQALTPKQGVSARDQPEVNLTNEVLFLNFSKP